MSRPSFMTSFTVAPRNSESALQRFRVADTMTHMTPGTEHVPAVGRAEIHRVLVPRDHIARRVRELADEIVAAYEGKELTIVVVLTGALTFTADLIRQLPIPLRIEPVSVCSYLGAATRPHEVKFRLPLPSDLQGCDVLIVDDIFDSGQTMGVLVAAARQAGARDVKRCALLRKARPDLPDRDDNLDFYGFDIPDVFVVGYGLDYNGYFRNMPDVAVLKIHSDSTREDAT
jgi:hypoxanthine phosphoribosyltransferase